MSDSKPSRAAGPGGILNTASFSLVPHLCFFSPLPYLCSVSPLVGIPFVFELRNTLVNVWKWTLTFILHFVEKAIFSHLLMVNICYTGNTHSALLTGIEKCPLMHHKWATTILPRVQKMSAKQLYVLYWKCGCWRLDSLESLCFLHVSIPFWNVDTWSTTGAWPSQDRRRCCWGC